MCIYSGLKYSTQEVNRNFKIKVSGESNGQKVHKLVGVSGLLELIGVELANSLMKTTEKLLAEIGLAIILFIAIAIIMYNIIN